MHNSGNDPFLDLGFQETKQEEFDGDIKDRPTSLKDIKKLVYNR